MRNRIIAIAFLIQIFFVGGCSAEQLTLEYCINTALEKHPDLIAAASRIDSKKASIGEAAADGRPQVNAGSSYTRQGSSEDYDSGSYSTSVTLEQSIYDWGRRDLSISGARLEAGATASDYLAVRDEVIANVRESYYELNGAIRENEVAKTKYANYEKRLVWAKAYYSAGTKAKIEVTKAESDLASAKLMLVKTISSISQYKASLASAIGLPLLQINGISDELDYTDWNIGIEDALSRADKNRPEIAAQKKRVESARTKLQLQKKGLSPSLKGTAGYGIYGSSPADTGEWTAKVAVSIPLSDGGLTKSKVNGATANLAEADAAMKSLSNSVMLEIRKSWEALLESKEALVASNEAERQAKETLDLALERYKAGVGNSLEVSDAVDSYAEAQTNTVKSLYSCKKARLDIEKAMGGLN